MQLADVAAAIRLEYMPAPHAMQPRDVLAAGSSLYRPRLHAVQLEAPDNRLLYRPAEQTVHSKEVLAATRFP